MRLPRLPFGLDGYVAIGATLVMVGALSATVWMIRESGKSAQWKKDEPVIAKDLLIGMDHLSGDAVFYNIDIGKDSSTLTMGGLPTVGLEGQFGQEADRAVISGLQQRFYSTHAGEFHLTGMALNLKFDGSECFSTIRQ